MLRNLISGVLLLLAKLTKPQISIIEGDKISLPFMTKSSSNVNYTYWLDSKTGKKFKIHNIVEKIRAEEISVSNPLCTKSEIFRSSIDLVWFICDEGKKFIVRKFDKSFRIPQIERQFTSKENAKFIDGSSTEDDQHFISLQILNKDMFITLYSFKENKVIHEIKMPLDNAGFTYKNPRLGLYCRSELAGNDCYGIIHDWRGSSKHIIMLKYSLNGNVKKEIKLEREFNFGSLPGVKGEQIEAFKEVERKLMISFRNKAEKKMYHTYYNPYEGKPYFKHLKTVVESFEEGDQIFMVEDFMGEFRLLRTHNDKLSRFSFGYIKEKHGFGYQKYNFPKIPCGLKNEEHYIKYANPGNARAIIVVGKKSDKSIVGFMFLAYGETSPMSMIRCYIGENYKYVMFHAAYDEYIAFTDKEVQYYSHENSWIDFDTKNLEIGKNTIPIHRSNNITQNGKRWSDLNLTFKIENFKDVTNFVNYDEKVVDYFRANTHFHCFVKSTCHASVLSFNEFKSNAGSFVFSGNDLEIDEENFKSIKLEFPKSDQEAKVKSINLLEKDEIVYVLEGKSEAEYVKCDWNRMAIQKCDNITIFSVSDFETVFFNDIDLYIITYGKSKTGENSKIQVNRKTDGAVVKTINLDHVIKSVDYLERSSSSILFYIGEKKTEKKVYKIIFEEYGNELKVTGPTLQDLRDTYHQICPELLRVHPYRYDELWVLSKCQNKEPIVLNFEYTENPLFAETWKALKFEKSQNIDNFCPAFSSIIYLDKSKNKIWMKPTRSKSVVDESKFYVPLDFLKIKNIIDFDCVPGRNTVQVLVESENKKYFMVNLLGLRTLINTAHSRIHSIKEITGIEEPKKVMVETREGGRNIYALIISNKLRDKKLFRISIENNEIYYRSTKNGKFIEPVHMRYHNFQRTKDKDLPFTIKVDKVGKKKPEIYRYKPFKTEDKEIDISKQLELRGPYFGIELNGPEKEKIKIDDKLTPEKSPLADNEMDDYVGSFKNFVITGTTKKKVELHKDIFDEKKKESIKIGDGATEAIIFGSDDKKKTFVVSRKRTPDGNHIELFWFNTNTESIKKEGVIKSYKLITKGDEFGLFGIFNKTKKKNFVVVGLMHQSRKSIKIFYFDFLKDYEGILTVSVERAATDKFIKNIVIDQFDRVRLQMSGMRSTVMQTEEPGHNPRYIRTYNVINKEHVHNIFCDFENSCIFETSTNLYYVAKGVNKIIEKVPDYRILGGSFYFKYLAVIAEKLEIDDSKERVLKLFVFSTDRDYLHSSYDLEIPKKLKIDNYNRMLTVVKRNNFVHSILTSNKIKVKLNSKNNLLFQEQNKNFQLKLQDEIKAKVVGKLENPDELKFILKGEDSKENTVRGFYKDDGVDPNKKDKKTTGGYFFVIFILILLLGILICMLIFCLKKKEKRERTFSEINQDLNAKFVDGEEDEGVLL